MKIDVAVATDDNYAKYCATTMYSVMKNKAEDDEIVFHILHSGISEESLEKISKIGNVIFYKVDDAEFSPYIRDVKLTWATPTLYRLKMASILDIKKVIYLDCDIIVRTSLKELFNTSISDHVLAGVPDVSWEAHRDRLNLDKDKGFYFNAGMVFMNLEKIRKDDLEKELFDFLIKNWQHLDFSDQDVLNSVFYGKVLELPEKFNYIPAGRFHDRKKIESLPKDISIIHYAGSKPWERGFSNPFEKEFWRCFKEVGFLNASEFDLLYKEHKKSRKRLRQFARFLKCYPFPFIDRTKREEFLNLILG